jgi:hypothetical protein
MSKKTKSSNLLAKKYEAAWHKLFYELPTWKQAVIIEEPHGRYADELAHEAAVLAESSVDLDLLHYIPNSGINAS